MQPPPAVNQVAVQCMPTLSVASFRGVVSHSDGPRYNATGRLYFYITPMDELTQNIMVGYSTAA